MRKVSIHYPRPGKTGTLRYIGYTREFVERKGADLGRPERTHAEWRGVEFGPSYFVEFRFRIPESELRPLAVEDADEVLWLQPPPTGGASEVTILSGPASHEGLHPGRSDGGAIELIAEHRLANGRLVWVQHHHIPAPPEHVLQSYREMVLLRARQEGWLNDPMATSTTSRINLTMDCEDGSAAEVEMAADFLHSYTRDA